jgi:hypothetical protein
MLGGSPTFTACKLHEPNMVRIYCFDEASEVVCSGKQLFCEMLRKQSAAPVDAKGHACTQYMMPEP